MAVLVQTARTGSNQGIPLGLYFVFDIVEFLPLTSLLALQGPDLVLDTGG